MAADFHALPSPHFYDDCLTADASTLRFRSLGVVGIVVPYRQPPFDARLFEHF